MNRYVIFNYKMDFQTLDLNLLRVFATILEEGSVSRAASRLGLSQPALSNALARLRREVGDPLFVRKDRRMLPTARARALAGSVQGALARMRDALEPEPPFDPARSERVFRIAINDYLEARLLPGIASRVLGGPGLRLEVSRVVFLFAPPARELEEGELDAAIGFLPGDPPPQSGLLAKALFSEDWVCISRPGVPKVDRRRFLAAPQARVVYRGGNEPGQVDRALMAQGLERNVRIVVPHLLPLVALAQGSGVIAAVPHGLPACVPDARVRIDPVPVPLPRLVAKMTWHERTHDDEGCRWLRERIAEAAATSAAGSPSRGPRRAPPSRGRPRRSRGAPPRS
jgi:DNA-binding transcriptional LysR family regulator